MENKLNLQNILSLIDFTNPYSLLFLLQLHPWIVALELCGKHLQLRVVSTHTVVPAHIAPKSFATYIKPVSSKQGRD
jgi:hypothetical protein